MSSQSLYTGSLKVVRQKSTSEASMKAPTRERLFPVPERFVSAARAWLETDDGAQAPCQLKTAASVVFVRDGKDGIETILTYRTGESPLGTVAFPGGLCQASDRDQIAWYGPDATTWASAFKQDDVLAAHAAVVGAIRESFEEIGMLLAGPDELSTVEASGAGCDQMTARESVAHCEKNFADYVGKRGLVLRTDLLRPVARWQSPNYRHKRYDTHYFACPAPVGQSLKLLESKGVWGKWVNVRSLLEQKDTSVLGDMIGAENTVGKKLEELLVPGTLCLLESLAAASTAVAYLAQKRAVQVKKADIVEQDGELYLKYTLPCKPGAREKCTL